MKYEEVEKAVRLKKEMDAIGRDIVYVDDIKKDKDDFVTVRNVESRPDFVQIFGEAKVRICDAVLKELKDEYNRVYAELKKL